MGKINKDVLRDCALFKQHLSEFVELYDLTMQYAFGIAYAVSGLDQGSDEYWASYEYALQQIQDAFRKSGIDYELIRKEFRIIDLFSREHITASETVDALITTGGQE